MADPQGIEEAFEMTGAHGITEEAVTPMAEETIEDKDNLNKMDCDEDKDDVTKMECDESIEIEDKKNKIEAKPNTGDKGKKDHKKEDPEKKERDLLREKESIRKIKRFCFLGSFKPVYIHLRGYIRVGHQWPIVKDLVKDVGDGEFLTLMREVLIEAPVVRRDEALFVYAAYLASSVDIACKTAMRIAFPILIRSDDELFLFCKYTSLINKLQNRKCFSRTVRRAIKAWYEIQPPEDIRSMWLSHRGLHSFTHKVLIKLCHVNDENIGSVEVASTFFKTCTELMKEAEPKDEVQNIAQAATGAENIAQPQAEAVPQGAENVVEPPVDGTNVVEPQDVVKNVSASVTTTIPPVDQTNITDPGPSTSSKVTEAQIEKDKSKVAPKKKKSSVSPTPTSVIIGVAKLRTTQKKHDAIKIIRKFKLSYSQVPGYWLRFPVIMEAVLPTMSYLQILKCWRKMARYNHFENNPKIFKICKKMLENVELAMRSSIYPVHILMSRHDVAKDSLCNLPVEKVKAARLEYLDKLYKDSFDWPATPGKLRMHITMNLQSNYKKKFLKNHKKLSYYDACLALSLGFSRREAKVDVFYWGKESSSIKQIPFARNSTIEMAFNTCDMVVNEKNSQRLVAPILSTLSSKQLYDVFLCIVPTAGRGNPKQRSEFLANFLQRYRDDNNPDARLIILDLLKFNRPSMTYSAHRYENILEICGLDDHTINLIHNFATHRFD